tara:strand:- start:158 stop:1228 length:1071 start_codon:yes stop_codon:yes gene_type:complete
MKIAIRADASYEMGSGHVVRSLVLADTITAQGCRVVFVCRLLDGHLISTIRDRGFEVVVLGGDSASTNSATSTDWLGVSQQEDAKNTIENLKGRLIDILFVDHYSLDTEWETLIRPHVGSIAVIDDLANRDHNCDFLIDQNFRNDNLSCYKALVPENCKTLLGLRYAILSSEYLDYRNKISSRDGVINRALVYFGGTDWQNMTLLALKTLSKPKFSFLEVDVVVGSNYPFFSDLEKLIDKRPKTKLHQQLPSLAKLMSIADIAIGAGGTSLWERMSMGLPALVVSLAENQVRSCEALQKENLINYLGSYKDLSNDLLSKNLRDMIHSPKDNYKLSSRISEHVDGYGANRIVQAMEI